MGPFFRILVSQKQETKGPWEIPLNSTFIHVAELFGRSVPGRRDIFWVPTKDANGWGPIEVYQTFGANKPCHMGQ